MFRLNFNFCLRSDVQNKEQYVDETKMNRQVRKQVTGKLTLHGDFHMMADSWRYTVRRLTLINTSTMTRNVWNDHYCAKHSET